MFKRLYNKIKKTPACWLWTGVKNNKGYGLFFFDKKLKLAHRVLWEITNGNIPEGVHVLHRCDNPACVNPSHLFLGSQKDNMVDMTEKGRNKNAIFLGEQNGRAKLTSQEVLSIREKHLDKTTTAKETAKKYGVNPSTIQDILSRKSWKHI